MCPCLPCYQVGTFQDVMAFGDITRLFTAGGNLWYCNEGLQSCFVQMTFKCWTYSYYECGVQMCG